MPVGSCSSTLVAATLLAASCLSHFLETLSPAVAWESPEKICNASVYYRMLSTQPGISHTKGRLGSSGSYMCTQFSKYTLLKLAHLIVVRVVN